MMCITSSFGGCFSISGSSKIEAPSVRALFSLEVLVSELRAFEIAARAQDHLRCLIYGLDPRTQQPFTDTSVLTDAHVLRSLIFALEVIEQRSELSFEDKKQGRRAGVPWNTAEDAKLLRGFRSGSVLKELAKTHERGEEGIVSRLARLNAVSSRKDARMIFHQRQKAQSVPTADSPLRSCTREPSRLGGRNSLSAE